MDENPTSQQYQKQFKTRKFIPNIPGIPSNRLTFPVTESVPSSESIPTTSLVKEPHDVSYLSTEMIRHEKSVSPLIIPNYDLSPPISPSRTKMGKIWIDGAKIELASLLIIDLGGNLLRLESQITFKRLKNEDIARLYFSVSDHKQLRDADGKVFVQFKLSVAHSYIGVFLGRMNTDHIRKEYYFSPLTISQSEGAEVVREMTFLEMDSLINKTNQSLEVSHLSIQIIATVPTML